MERISPLAPVGLEVAGRLLTIAVPPLLILTAIEIFAPEPILGLTVLVLVTCLFLGIVIGATGIVMLFCLAADLGVDNAFDDLTHDAPVDSDPRGRVPFYLAPFMQMEAFRRPYVNGYCRLVMETQIRHDGTPRLDAPPVYVPRIRPPR